VVLNDHLIVRGERRRPELAEGSHWTYAERTFSAFERRIQLPRGVKIRRGRREHDNGVLSLIVPKPEAMKPKTISIGSGGYRQLEAATA
jgi:HSP20 family protein